MLFSQRYRRALQSERLVVDLSPEVRRKLLTCFLGFNFCSEAPHRWSDEEIEVTFLLGGAILKFASEQGWKDIPGTKYLGRGDFQDAFEHVILECDGPCVLDLIEFTLAEFGPRTHEPCRTKINQIFDVHDCPWRIADGEFFKLDADFMGARLAADAHEILTAKGFIDAADAFARARRKLASGETREAIFHAQRSFESAMRAATGARGGNADQLIQGLVSHGYFSDLPRRARSAFTENVLKTLPFLNNKLGGRGEDERAEIPPVYGVLAIQLAAAFHNFLISKHVERTPPPPPQPAAEFSRAFGDVDDDIPF